MYCFIEGPTFVQREDDQQIVVCGSGTQDLDRTPGLHIRETLQKSLVLGHVLLG